MTKAIPNIEYPELVFGFVAAIGVDLKPTLLAFRTFFEREGYAVEEVHVTSVFKQLSKYIVPKKKLVEKPLKKRYESYIAYGNQLRQYFGDDSILSAATILQVIQQRNSARHDRDTPYQRRVFLLHQFKRKEEIELLRSVYGRLFFQVSVYSRRGARVDFLAKRFADDSNTADNNRFRSDAEAIVQKDENEVDVLHGQRVASVFHDADFIVNGDINEPTVDEQVDRFLELIFSSNSISPSKAEYGMFLAKAAALRTLDLSRQVGAAIFSENGEVICLGSNEVPKAGGGTYWADDNFDNRDYVRKHDSNDRRKRELLTEILEAYDPDVDLSSVFKNKKIADSQFMDALEYGRIVHAEMSAISDAARNGRSVKDAVLYCTTFPCHMCAKHIVASGVKCVVFLEPYPKSLASDLHSDAIEVENSDRGPYKDYPAVRFEHFFGVTPRRYRELFEKVKRKNRAGDFLDYNKGNKRPYIDIKAPFYVNLEEYVLKITSNEMKSRILGKAKL